MFSWLVYVKPELIILVGTLSLNKKKKAPYTELRSCRKMPGEL